MNQKKELKWLINFLGIKRTAAMLGVSRWSIYSWMGGKTDMKASQFLKILKIINCIKQIEIETQEEVSKDGND